MRFSRSFGLSWPISAVLVLLYTSAWMFLARNLTFYWDDYFILDSTFNDSFLELVASGVNGNWWPVASLVTWVEVRLFGTWYLGYIFINALLNIVNGLLLWMVARGILNRPAPWYLVAPVALYPLTLQVAINATVLTPSWPLSVTWALMAVVGVMRKWSGLVVVGLLVLSWLSMSGMFVINATLVACLSFAYWCRSGDLGHAQALRAAVLIPLGGLGTLIGYQVVRLSPPNGVVQEDVGSVLLSGLELSDLLQAVTALTGSWLLAPVTPLAFVYEASLRTTTILILNHTILFVVACIGALLVGVLIYRSKLVAVTNGARIGAVSGALLFPIILLAAVLAIARSGNSLAPRYGIMWLIPVAVLWLGLLLLLAERSRVLRITAGVVGTGMLLLAVALLPVTAGQAFDVDRPRSTDSGQQAKRIDACLSGLDTMPMPSMAPGLEPGRFCPIMRQLDAVWWFR